jgi:hypothetical protein
MPFSVYDSCPGIFRIEDSRSSPDRKAILKFWHCERTVRSHHAFN